MGHTAISTAIFVGLARLPQPFVAAEQTLAVELEIELPTRRILAVSSTLQLPGLARLLRETLVGECVASVSGALLDLEVRSAAPFTSEVCAAVKRALQRATIEVSPDVPAVAQNGSLRHALAAGLAWRS